MVNKCRGRLSWCVGIPPCRLHLKLLGGAKGTWHHGGRGHLRRARTLSQTRGVSTRIRHIQLVTLAKDVLCIVHYIDTIGLITLRMQELEFSTYA